MHYFSRTAAALPSRRTFRFKWCSLTEGYWKRIGGRDSIDRGRNLELELELEPELEPEPEPELELELGLELEHGLKPELEWEPEREPERELEPELGREWRKFGVRKGGIYRRSGVAVVR